jgi:glycosyltransferase involved in cell wall biosynthesis
MTARVVYWNNIPSPYVVGRFNAVANRGNVAFEAWFNTRKNPDRSWDVLEDQWQFPARYIPPAKVAGRSLHLPLAELRETQPDLVICLYNPASFALGSIAMAATGVRFAYRVLPTFDSWVRRSNTKELSKKALFRLADAAKVPGPDGAAMALRYGVPEARIFTVRQSIDVDHFGAALDVSSGVRCTERENRGLRGCVFVYVGRLWQGKGLDYLFDAFARVHGQNPETSLLIVGDGVDEERYRARAKHIPNVHFEGFVQPANLPSIYAIADVLVFPTLGDPHGLVAEEAMAAGLPVIVSKAAGDIDQRLPDGKAGFIVPPASAEALADRMLDLAADSATRVRFAECGREIVLSRTHDAYAADVETMIDRVLSLPRRHPLPVRLSALTRSTLRLGARRAPAPMVNS